MLYGSAEIVVKLGRGQETEGFTLRTDVEGRADIDRSAKGLRRWSPADPYRHTITFSSGDDAITDRIGLRTVATSGEDILINGKPVFLRGICMPDRIPKISWGLAEHGKPLIISEFGAGAKASLRGPREERWTVDHQDWMYEETLKMLDKIPSLRGIMPWLLVDFRSARRNLSGIQDGWNRKGIIGSDGTKKPAFYRLQSYYMGKAAEYGGDK